MKYNLYFGDDCFITLPDKKSALQNVNAIGEAKIIVVKIRRKYYV